MRAGLSSHRNQFATHPVLKLQLSGIEMSTSELACTYASLILHDEGIEVTVRLHVYNE